MLRRVVQYAALFVFVALFVWSRRGGWPGMLVNFPMRLDPLAMLAHLVSSRTLLTGSALALATVALTVVFGRAWCGWLCPLGTLLDWFSPRRRPRPQAPPDSWRAVKYGLLLTLLAAALFSNLTLMVFDPLTLLFRTLSASVWPAIDQLITAAQFTLYRVPILRPALSALDAVLRPKILPPDAAYYRYAWLYAGVFAAIISLNVFGRRFWCRYLCPVGTTYNLIGWLSPLKIRWEQDKCSNCKECQAVCMVPFVLADTVNRAKGEYVLSGECTRCGLCVDACQDKALSFKVRYLDKII